MQGTCSKCRRKKRLIKHHITYTPSRVVRICPKCHGVITFINATAAIVLKRKLDNKDRVLLWLWSLDLSPDPSAEHIARAVGVPSYIFSKFDLLFISNARKSVTKVRKRSSCKS